MLHGREIERARLAAVVEGTRRGRASVVVLRGEPGIGKSALIHDLAAQAVEQGVRVLQTQGLESESPLAFGSLHRLLRPVTGVVDRLPAPQADAVRIAFAQQVGAPVEPFLVGVATLSLLTEAAEQNPLLCIVDDAHWLDDASADALLFAARRLEADRVAVVFAARDAATRAFVAEGIETVAVGGLDPTAVQSLLAQHTGGPVAAEVARRLGEETGGNPLALVELPAHLTPAQLNGAAPLPPRVVLSAGVEEVFLERIRGLTPPAQTLMLVVAADDTGRWATTIRAAASLGVGPTAWDEAEQAGLLLVEGDTVRVRHPVVRSAVYQVATSRERRRAHRAIADALAEAGGDPDRQVWHRAAAAEGWDESIAQDLSGVGAHDESRGGYASAAAAYERAAELTPAEPDRPARLYAAARNAWASGQAARASALCAAARGYTVDPLLRADIDRLRGRIEVNVGSPTAAHRIFAHAARAVAEVDPVRALELAVAERVLHNYGADSGASPSTGLIPVEVGPHDPARVRCLKELLVAATLAAAADWGGARTALQAALDSGREVTDLDVLANLGNTALHLGDDRAGRRCYAAMLSVARESGAGMSVAYALQRLAFTHFLAGQWTEVRASAEEVIALSRSVGEPALTAAPLGWLTLLAALQGRSDYDALRGDLEDLVSRHPLGILTDPVHDLGRWAKGVRAGQAGDWSAAAHHFGELRLSTVVQMAATDRLEAASRAGEKALLADLVGELTPFAAGTGWPWALGVVAHGRALIATSNEDSGQDPAGHFERAPRQRREQTVRPGSRPPGLRRVAPPPPTPGRRPEPPAYGAEDLRGPGGGPAGGPGRGGAAGIG